MTRNPYDKPVIPSQAPSKRTPYAPLYRPDPQIQRDPGRPSPSGYPALGAYVVSTFGTLPVNGIDFYHEFGGHSTANAANVSGSFDLPPGGRLLLRYLILAVVIEFDPAIPNFVGGTDINGLPVPFVSAADGVMQFDQVSNEPPSFTILANGAAIRNYGSQPLFGPTRNPRTIPVHTMIEEGSTLGLSVSYVSPTETGNLSPPMSVYGAFMGNWLLNRGEDLPLAPVNTDSIPIRDGMK